MDITNWNYYKLDINTNKGPVSVEWNNVEEVAKYATLQSGLFAGADNKLTKRLFFEKFPQWAQQQWTWTEKLGGFDLPPDPTIIDIGSGISVLDLLLYSYANNSKFYLVDKNLTEFKQGIYYSNNYPFYNNWDPVLDAISTSNFDSSRFNIQDPSVAWPEADCISSYYSWCFHYPLETYWQRVQESLKIGGKLILDVRLIKDKNVIGEITESFKCQPALFEYPNVLPKWIDGWEGPNPLTLGYRCVWTRN